MRCHLYDADRCRSCTWIEVPHPEQVARKEAQLRELLDPFGTPRWEAPVTGPEAGFRNKAKMVVAGTVDSPTLGILDERSGGVDLRECPLHTPGLQAALPVLAGFVATAALTPYDVAARRGELKHLLVTESPDGELMVRFVLRSTESLPRIRKHLPSLLDALPARVVSANLQPVHKAVLEGPEELALHGETLTMRVNGRPLHLRPRSFFQTNTTVAAALYRTAADWAQPLVPRGGTVWDLYGGVGGFAVHLAGAVDEITVTGVEISEEAVASARTTAAGLGLAGARFEAADATAWAVAQPGPPDLVVVNPPRRGVGEDLATWLEGSGVGSVLYSSCNATSLARDLQRMPSLRPVRARLFDMFPHTGHYEVLTLLARG